MASMFTLFTSSVALLSYGVNSEAVQCSFIGTDICACQQPGLCQLYCNEKDACKGSNIQLQCYPGYPCEIYCGGEQSCQDARSLAKLASSAYLECSGKTSCKGSNGLYQCGTGDCSLSCADSTACSDLLVNTSHAASFQCTGFCPLSMPLNYSPNPSSSPTHSPTRETSISPSPDPTADPSIAPTHSPSSSPVSVSNAPSLTPTQSPNITPAPTANPSSTPSHSPSSNAPSYSPTLQPTPLPTTSDPSASPTDSPSISITVQTAQPSASPSFAPSTESPSATIQDTTTTSLILTATESTEANPVALCNETCGDHDGEQQANEVQTVLEGKVNINVQFRFAETMRYDLEFMECFLYHIVSTFITADDVEFAICNVQILAVYGSAKQPDVGICATKPCLTRNSDANEHESHNEETAGNATVNILCADSATYHALTGISLSSLRQELHDAFVSAFGVKIGFAVSLDGGYVNEITPKLSTPQTKPAPHDLTLLWVIVATFGGILTCVGCVGCVFVIRACKMSEKLSKTLQEIKREINHENGYDVHSSPSQSQSKSKSKSKSRIKSESDLLNAPTAVEEDENISSSFAKVNSSENTGRDTGGTYTMVIGDHEQAAKVQESEYPMMEQRVYLTAERRRGDSEIAFGSIMQSDILQIKQVEVEQEDHTVHHEFAEGFEAETKEEDVEGGVVQVKQADAVVVVASAVVVDAERTHDQDFEVVDENEEETETEDVRTKMLNRSEKYQTKLVAIRSVDAVQNTDIGGKRHGQKKQKFSLP